MVFDAFSTGLLVLNLLLHISELPTTWHPTVSGECPTAKGLAHSGRDGRIEGRATGPQRLHQNSGGGKIHR